MYQLYLWFCKERGYIIEIVVEDLKRLGEIEKKSVKNTEKRTSGEREIDE